MRFIKAVKIFDGEGFLEPDSVLVFGDNRGLVEIIGAGDVSKDKTETFDGILTPGFINAHCHLELSHLKGEIVASKGLCAFAMDLMDKRDKFSAEQIHEAMTEAETEMIRNGIVAVGDISNNESSVPVKSEKKLHYHTFMELIGLNPSNAQPVFEKGKMLIARMRSAGLECSLAPHAPYSVSKQLIELIANENAQLGLPLTIHNQESIEEHKFFMGDKSQVYGLYEHLGISVDFFIPPGKSSLASYLPLLKGDKNILVHNTFTPSGDRLAATSKHVYWCLCPSANLYIENRLPDLEAFMEHPEWVCIGTDSLASNSRLDVLAELNVIAQHVKQSDERLLGLICANSAKALGLSSRYGTLKPGTTPGLNLLKKTGSKFELIKKVI